MRKIMAILALVAITAVTAVWVVLANCSAATLADLSDAASSAVYFTACFAAFAALVVALFDDRDPLQFFCAATVVAALLGLAAFHSTHTRGRDGKQRPRPVAEQTSTKRAALSALRDSKP